MAETFSSGRGEGAGGICRADSQPAAASRISSPIVTSIGSRVPRISPSKIAI